MGIIRQELSHIIVDGMITYQGLPAPIICDFMSREMSSKHYDGETTFHIGKIEMVGNTGTYMDCPFHRYADGKDFTHYPLNRFVDLPTCVVQLPIHQGAITLKELKGYDVENKAVLFATQWDRHWNTETYFNNHPYLEGEVASYLVDKRVCLVGIDSYNVDDTQINTRPVHTILLKNEIFILEHLTQLNTLPTAVNMTALPLRIEKMGSVPVRAFAEYRPVL